MQATSDEPFDRPVGQSDFEAFALTPTEQGERSSRITINDKAINIAGSLWATAGSQFVRAAVYTIALDDGQFAALRQQTPAAR